MFIYRFWQNKKEKKFIPEVKVNEFNSLFSASGITATRKTFSLKPKLFNKLQLVQKKKQ